MPSIDEPILLAAEPQVFVADIAGACAFYVGKLGFGVAFTYGDPPFYAQVARGGARLNLRLVSWPVFAADFRAREVDALSAIVTAEGIEPLYHAFDAAGVNWHQRLRREPWGARTFIVRDPDGNLIAFAGDGL